MPLKKFQVRCDAATHEALRRRAAVAGIPMGQVVRDAVTAWLRRPTLSDFRFVGSGRGEPLPSGPVSEQHDEALEEAFGAPFLDPDR